VWSFFFFSQKTSIDFGSLFFVQVLDLLVPDWVQRASFNPRPVSAMPSLFGSADIPPSSAPTGTTRPLSTAGIRAAPRLMNTSSAPLAVSVAVQPSAAATATGPAIAEAPTQDTYNPASYEQGDASSTRRRSDSDGARTAAVAGAAMAAHVSRIPAPSPAIRRASLVSVCV
jgi:hypothetical protein